LMNTAFFHTCLPFKPFIHTAHVVKRFL